jgi:hypothetical protein
VALEHRYDFILIAMSRIGSIGRSESLRGYGHGKLLDVRKLKRCEWPEIREIENV